MTQIVIEREIAPGSGAFVSDDRLRVETVDLRGGLRISEAVVAVRLDDAFDALDARARYGPDSRLIIRTDEPDAAHRMILLEGYPLLGEALRDGRPGGPVERFRLTVRGVYTRLAQDQRAWIYGRRMRSGRIVDGLAAAPEAFAARTVHVEALPCVFNLDGRGNRAAEPLRVVDGDGRTRRLFPFTYDGDPAAESWSLLDALRYLVWFHHLPEGPVSVRALLDATEAAAGGTLADGAAGAASSALVARLLRPAAELNCEATNLVEALALLAEAAGLRVHCLAEACGARVESVLRVWAPEDGAEKSHALAWGGRFADGTRRYQPDALPDRDIFHDNQLGRLALRWNYTAVVNAPVVVGAVKRWEMTVALWPGWRPEADLDNVAAADRPAAKSQALTPDMVEFLGTAVEQVPWYRQYHRQGAEFEEHRDVARLWVLNEDGAFDAATYDRNPPFDHYAPFDFADVADEAVARPGGWTRRPRPMRGTITAAADGSTLGVHVEVSFNSGGTWHPAPGPITVSADRAGIWFGLQNPTAMIPPGGDWYDENMWYALIDQVFRVRVTAVFDGDARAGARHSRLAGPSASVWQNTRLVYRPADYRFISRAGVINALVGSALAGAAAEIDDEAAAAALVDQIAAREADGVIEMEATIPWLDDAFQIGDRIARVRGRTVGLNGVDPTAGARGADWAVVGKRFDFAEGAPRTTLLLARRDDDAS